RDAFTEDPVKSLFNGKPTITVVVMKTPDEDALAIDDAVTQYVTRQQTQLPEGLSMEIWGRTSDMLRARIDLLLRNGLSGLLVVFIMLWLFLDIRLSFWVGMGMPVSIVGALIIMWAWGATINMISLFGLIMVLGIVVDDATVVGEAIYVHRKSGKPALKAAVDGAMEVAMPVFASVTTTIAAFVPLFFVGGIMGKFIAILPLVVISCLTISLVECFVCFPAHMGHLPDPNREASGGNTLVRFGRRFHRFTNQGLEWFVEHLYEPFLRRALAYRYVSMSVAAAVVIIMVGFLKAGFMKFEFFPKLDGDVMTASLEFPDGTPFTTTEEAAARMEEAARRLEAKSPTSSGKPLFVNTFRIVGSTINESQEPPKHGSNVASVRVQMIPSEERGLYSQDLMVAWEKEIGPIPGATALTFAGIGAGPPGAPIEIWLQGHNMDEILAAAEKIEAKRAEYEGVYQIQNDFRAGKNEIKLKLKPEARTLGITVADLARQVYAGYFGEEAVRLQRGRDDIRVRVRYPVEERSKFAEFERVRIRTPQGHEVPLLSVAEVSFGPGYASIKRTDGMRRVSVTAEIDSNEANASEIFAELGGLFFQNLRSEYPQVMVSFQGEQKKVRESLGGLTISYPLTLIAMYIIIATLFGSYIQPIIIMLTVPMGLIGAVLGHLLFGFPISFMSFMGMVALSGVVVNDAIVLIEAVNEFLAKGTPFFEAVHQGGARRFRAVFLTTVTTVGGLMPLMLEQDLQARFLIPMAVAICAGVAFATLLTLVLIPCLLASLNDVRCLFHWMLYRRWPTREEVEPATYREADLGMGEAAPAPAQTST
ncbi:MAG: efflux RND transporter permease subunit, partial [Candidatus Hydrogenedentes bacterium]|nr:efflux RND transporter permease subunit [Candidatus Hydrogenedentota bacterium]